MIGTPAITLADCLRCDGPTLATVLSRRCGDVAVDDHLVAPLVASVVALCGAHTVAILATEERGTHRLLHAALRRAFRRVEFVRRSTVRRCLARAEVDTAPADWVAVAVCRGVR